MNKNVDDVSFVIHISFLYMRKLEGEFIVSIPCGVKPSFNYHIKKVQGRVRRSVENIKERSNVAMDMIKAELESLKTTRIQKYFGIFKTVCILYSKTNLDFVLWKVLN